MQEQQDKINSSNYQRISNFKICEIVLHRNFPKNSKYDPYFHHDPLEIIMVNNSGHTLTLKRIWDEQVGIPEKMYHGSANPETIKPLEEDKYYLND